MKKVCYLLLACLLFTLLGAATISAATYTKTDSFYFDSIYEFTANVTGVFDYETGFSISGRTNWIRADAAPPGQYYTLRILNPDVQPTRIYFSYSLEKYILGDEDPYAEATPGRNLNSSGPY